MSLSWERKLPWVATAAVIILIKLAEYMGWWDPKFPEASVETAKFLLLGSSVTASASFAAFLLTTLSFLLGVDSPAAKRVLDSKYRDVLLSYFRQAIYGWLAFCLTSLAGYYFYSSKLYFYFWVALLVFAFCAFVRCARLLFLLLRQSETKY